MSAASPVARTAGAAIVFPLSRAECETLARAALEEDRAFDDVTTTTVVPATARASAVMVARSGGVIAGLPLAAVVFELLDASTTCRALVHDGASVSANASVLEIEGTARAVLSAERVALNFAQRLSGIATLTARYVSAVAGTYAKILDTRKTTPLMRALEKYAVRCGGGTNHRADLAAAVLIKDNHLATLGGDIALAVRRAREKAPMGIRVEVECDTREQVLRAVDAGADVILLDNMSPKEMATCVALVNGAAIVEASGGITLESVRAVAETGVDWISVGALTHSVPALDLALDFRSAESPA
ncbi:MAG: carboxylating nicotinate-nucleotide diphosphorylase [Gemmatimonadota bacterium]|nr:carboxylating nicotinate-nucleotide diphosphorylase [Gemmatimonadota bacterium]